MNKIKNSVNWHLQTAGQVFNKSPLWILLLPLGFMLLLLGLDQTPLSAYMNKDSAEIAAPMILAVAFTLSLFNIFSDQHIYHKWLAFFAFILFMRELHFYGTNNGFYIGFLLLMWWGSKYRQRLVPYFDKKILVSMIVLIIWTYLISKSFDRHYWDSLIPEGVESDLFEENLELIGHLLFLVLVFISGRMKSVTLENQP